MNVSVKNTRYEPNGSVCHADDPRKLSVAKAFTSLVQWELGYGGRVTGVHNDGDSVSLTIRTDMFPGGRYDVTVFSGDADSMRPLVLVAASLSSTLATPAVREKLVAAVLGAIDDRRPLVVAPLGVMVMSDLGVRPCALHAVGVHADQHHKLFEWAMTTSLADVCAFCELVLEGKSVNEASECVVS